ncbi:IclR family transcriptional regulator [Streptomyces sp. NBC_00094]|uniref:IclR family transcriptional regulator n=1 Tax=Streptomyces sp. NBC_00094 TaxID=2903620 RepID=UPI00224E17D3|nr:helix-turn-helix domain-containing protein [Streptomyces sp. NBC_00094]MCX5391243.1 helix-turn-helix domain-containing protein [Streptomyces sp. NBC_00094]
MPDRPPTGQTLIQSVQRAVHLLRALNHRGGSASAKQLARDADLPLPTAYHLLRTLCHEGLVRKDRHGYALADPGGLAVPQPSAPDSLPTQEWTDQLSLELNAAVYFVVYREGEIRVTAASRNPACPPVTEWADFRLTGHAHAAGQALLSQLSDEERADHLARHPATPLTRHTVAGRTAVERRLASRQRGAPHLEYEEYTLGTVCAAVPITVGSSAATLAISLPSARAAELQPLTRSLQARAESVLLDRTFSVTPWAPRPARPPRTREGAPGVPGAPSSTTERPKDGRQAS